MFICACVCLRACIGALDMIERAARLVAPGGSLSGVAALRHMPAQLRDNAAFVARLVASEAAMAAGAAALDDGTAAQYVRWVVSLCSGCGFFSLLRGHLRIVCCLSLFVCVCVYVYVSVA